MDHPPQQEIMTPPGTPKTFYTTTQSHTKQVDTMRALGGSTNQHVSQGRVYTPLSTSLHDSESSTEDLDLEGGHT